MSNYSCRGHLATFALFLLIAIVSPTLTNNHIPIKPANDLNPKQVALHCYEIEIEDLHKSIDLYWVTSTNRGRQHSIITCSKIKNLTVNKMKGDILNINEKWVSEVFIQEDRLHLNYMNYLFHNPFPVRHPGSRIIIETAKHNMSLAMFRKYRDIVISRL